ncbi:GNAT family N-acetyltransferase [Streptococcaceae bacterium ESL0729]|nr:GNAT family N-acetyltransferase [Streptococcaceae bacterium ESL0729]
MKLMTDHLLLRPWSLEDVEGLYKYAQSPEIGSMAGWPRHESLADSKWCLENILMTDLSYALTLKEDSSQVIGAIALKVNEDLGAEDLELGYWLGRPFWGQGLIPEAVEELNRYAFTNNLAQTIWCQTYAHNLNSKRVQEKTGFIYEKTVKDVFSQFLNKTVDLDFSRLDKASWFENLAQIKS